MTVLHRDDCTCNFCVAVETAEQAGVCVYCGMSQPGPHNGACPEVDPPDDDYVASVRAAADSDSLDSFDDDSIPEE